MADSKANLSISWRAVAIAAAVIALAAVSVTAIVATIKQADTLSVVALSVAVIAFVIQILVFIVQAAAATEQGLRAQEIYGSTLKVLATIEEKAEGTQQAVSTISDRMLTAIIGKANAEVVQSGAPVDSAAFSREVAERVAELVRQLNVAVPDEPTVSRNRVRRTTRQDGASSTTRDKLDALIQAGLEYPSADVMAPVLNDLNALDGSALQYLALLARDFRDLYFMPSALGYRISSRERDELRRAGLIRRVEGTKDDRWTLSDKGRVAASIILAPEIPADAPPGVEEVRRKTADIVSD